jgi:hypothetical protein
VPDAFRKIASIDGLVAAYVVDRDRGNVEGFSRAGSQLDLELDAVNNGEVLGLAQAVIATLDPAEQIRTLLFALGAGYHVIRPSSRDRGRFLYLILDRIDGNLGLLLHLLEDAGP